MRSNGLALLGGVALGVIIAVATVQLGSWGVAADEWEYGEFGMLGRNKWWEEGNNEATTIRVDSLLLLGQKLGATTEITHSTGITNLLAEQGWEPVLMTGAGDVRIMFRRRRE